MTRSRHARLSLAVLCGALLLAAPARPLLADAITKVRGTVTDNKGKPLPKVPIYFEAVEIKKRVGPLKTNKEGEFFIATLDVSVAKKWKVVPELPGFKVVKVSYEIVASTGEERGKGDHIPGTKQEMPELLFALVGDEGRNVVNIVMAKEADLLTAIQEERRKKEEGAAPPQSAAAGTGVPGAAAPESVPAAAPPALPPGGRETLEKAKGLTDAGRHAEAVELYRSYLAKDPTGNPAVYYYLGKSLFEEKETAAAEEAFKKGLELKPDMKGAHFYLGTIRLNDEDAAGALAELGKELVLTPDSDSLHFNLGRAYEKMGQDDKAIEEFEKAATINNTKPEPLMLMAAIYEKRKDTAKASEMYERIKAIDPKNAAILFYNVGAKARNENRSKDAVQAFQKAVDIDPTYAPAHRELGYAMVSTGDFKGATLQFQEYLKLSPSAPDAKDIRETIAALK